MTAEIGPAAERALGPRRPHQGRRLSRCGARGRAAHPERRAQRSDRAADARAAARHPGTLRRARQADVRPAVARVPGRHHARRHVHARPRAELPHLPGDRHHRRPPRLSHHSDDPEQIAKYSKINTYQTQLFAWFLEKLRRRPTATARCSTTRCSSTAPASATRTCTPTSTCRSPRRRPAAAQGRPSPRLPRRHADDQPALSMLDRVGRAGRHARRQHRPPRRRTARRML